MNPSNSSIEFLNALQEEATYRRISIPGSRFYSRIFGKPKKEPMCNTSLTPQNPTWKSLTFEAKITDATSSMPVKIAEFQWEAASSIQYNVTLDAESIEVDASKPLTIHLRENVANVTNIVLKSTPGDKVLKDVRIVYNQLLDCLNFIHLVKITLTNVTIERCFLQNTNLEFLTATTPVQKMCVCAAQANLKVALVDGNLIKVHRVYEHDLVMTYLERAAGLYGEGFIKQLTV